MRATAVPNHETFLGAALMDNDRLDPEFEAEKHDCYGDAYDNNALLLQAIELSKGGTMQEKRRAVLLLQRLREHILASGELKSRIWLLPVLTPILEKLNTVVRAAAANGTLV
jgi:hypothetical protein